MITYQKAQQIIDSFAHSFGSETIPLDDAPDRVLAEDVFADRDYPPFNRAAMDGFAIRLKDLQEDIEQFEILDTIYAGSATDKKLSAGQCFKIMTGACCPPSADVVIRREDSFMNGNEVSFSVREVKSYQNIARKGEDLQAGKIVLRKGMKCTLSIIGILASLGRSEVKVEKLPSVAIITTGNEVKPIDQPVSDVQIRNSNLHVLKAFLKKCLIKPAFVLHVQDEKQELEKAFAEALQYDIVIVSGGVSAGDADYVPGVLQSLSVQQLFHKVAIKPGKPIWCGHKEKTMVFALPGNPFSCVVTFSLFVRYYVERCYGFPSTYFLLPLQNGRKQKVKLDEFFPVEIIGNPSSFSAVSLNGSGDIRIGLGAQALALQPVSQSEISQGESIMGILL